MEANNGAVRFKFVVNLHGSSFLDLKNSLVLGIVNLIELRLNLHVIIQSLQGWRLQSFDTFCKLLECLRFVEPFELSQYLLCVVPAVVPRGLAGSSTSAASLF